MSTPVIRLPSHPRFEMFPAVDGSGTLLDLSDDTVYFVYRINKGNLIELEASVFGDSNEGAFVSLEPEDLSEGYIEWVWKVVDAFGTVEYTRNKRKAQIRPVF